MQLCYQIHTHSLAPQSHHMQCKHKMITSKIRSGEITPFPLFPTFWFYRTVSCGSVHQDLAMISQCGFNYNESFKQSALLCLS